jgi:hypothetical protein
LNFGWVAALEATAFAAGKACALDLAGDDNLAIGTRHHWSASMRLRPETQTSTTDEACNARRVSNASVAALERRRKCRVWLSSQTATALWAARALK